jgi:ABC-type glycerol-3-phosphate transport system permease component
MDTKADNRAYVSLASVPVAVAYNLFLDYFISGITGGALK